MRFWTRSRGDTFFPGATRSGYFVEVGGAASARGEVVVECDQRDELGGTRTPDLEPALGDDAGILILALEVRKPHLRKAPGVKSFCGRADGDKDTFEVYVEFPHMANIASVCKHCFPGETVDSVSARY